jgi:hypothetical protein
MMTRAKRHGTSEKKLMELLTGGFFPGEVVVIFARLDGQWHGLIRYQAEVIRRRELTIPVQAYFNATGDRVMMMAQNYPELLVMFVESVGYTEDSLLDGPDAAYRYMTHDMRLAPLDLDLYVRLVGAGVDVTRVICREEGQ